MEEPGECPPLAIVQNFCSTLAVPRGASHIFGANFVSANEQQTQSERDFPRGEKRNERSGNKISSIGQKEVTEIK